MRVRSTLCVPLAFGVSFVALSATFVAHALAQEESVSRDPGIYMAAAAQTPPQYVMVHAHPVSDSSQSGVAKSILSQGLTGISITLAVSGSKASLRAPSSDLVFLFQLNNPPPPAKASKGANQPPPDIASIMAQAGKNNEMPPGMKNPDAFSLIRATVDGDTRRLDLGSQGGKKILGGSRRAKDAVDLSVEKLGPDLFRVKAKSPLGPGEYAFTMTQGSGQVWDFGVEGR